VVYYLYAILQSNPPHNMIYTLPETYQNYWHECIQNLWLERATLRLIFQNDLDDIYNSKYTEILRNLENNRMVETESNPINLFNHYQDLDTWSHEHPPYL
jgi:hypothetical protein